MAKNVLKPGYYLRIVAHAIFEKEIDRDKLKVIIERYISSLTGRRPEVYIGSRKDIRKVVNICLTEIFMRNMPDVRCPESNLTFVSMEKFEVFCYYYKQQVVHSKAFLPRRKE